MENTNQRCGLGAIPDNEAYDSGGCKHLGWQESDIILGLVQQYRSTHNLPYLTTAWERIQVVLDLRDSERGVFDYKNRSRPLWRNVSYQFPKGLLMSQTDEYNHIHNTSGQGMSEAERSSFSYHWIVHTGKILLPIILFSETIYSDKELYGDDLWIERAKLCLEATRAGVDEHMRGDDPQWVENRDIGYFQYEAAVISKVRSGEWESPNLKYTPNIPYNMQNIFGSVLVHLHLTYQLIGYEQDSALFKMYAEKLAKYLKNGLVEVSTEPGKSRYTWKYHSNHADPAEDASHAALNIQFAKLCYDNGIIFTYDDMQKFASTFKHMIFHSDGLQVKHLVDGTMKFGVSPGKYRGTMGRWVDLADIDESIFIMCYEIYSEGISSVYTSSNMLKAFQSLSND
ncbi:MAG: hypothetical protein HN995_09925 [Candidatus Marinimicrobia bacterium]|jgi:hypothetical protein|nr:hypothetical protein [Candidatus Neomarinimicrobiota bacterium]MBT3576560.1 hypothetical protein [Candidatus Neomarinimicrobiota bacterium]MBT3680166.1 hypothetical protein [Candidatus Neomarinimicrobiota bacterium]MBT3949813.1 hypothetical protein [Candidatus Neomarinimicrobiota bacterium]MBT4253535.1 hypothetical protein [Candidatus Neomarinimicrobiota bacterium]